MQIPVTFIPDEESGYTAICSIYSVVTEGETLQDAEKNMQEALQCHLEGLEKLKVDNRELYQYELVFLKNLQNAKYQFLSFS